MQCVTPMVRYYQDPKCLTGREREQLRRKEIKLTQRIIPRHEVLEKLENNENFIRGLSRLNEIELRRGSIWRYQAIPCGHCYACQLNYSAQWATRIMCECKKSEHNYFITFTYDEEHLPIAESSTYNGITYENDGTWTGTLWPDDITKFLNSLRQYIKRKYNHTGIKYFYAGEYCPTSGRSHYHMILMNCPLDIKEFYDFHVDNRTKKLHWKSHEIERYWDQGFIDIGEVEWSSAAYVARYCMKKLDTNPDKTSYYKVGKLPEFVRMSRRPGIGAEYYDNNYRKIYDMDGIIMRNFHGNIVTYKPPKAWDRKFKEAHPEEWESIQESRQAAAERAQSIEREMSNYTDLERLKMKAEGIISKANMLPREFEYDF